MKKNLLAVAVALGLWHSAVLGNLPTDELPGKVSPTIDEISFQPLVSASSPMNNDPFAKSSEGAYLVAPICWTFIDRVNGRAQEICY